MAKKFNLSTLRNTDIKSLSEKELRAAYSTYYDALRKRINRLSEGTVSQKRQAAPFLPGGSQELKKIRQLDNPSFRELQLRVRTMQILETKERMSLSGWKKIEERTIKSLQEAGYKNINKSNIKNFGKYMEAMRSAFNNKIFPSSEAAETYDGLFNEISDMSGSELNNFIEGWASNGGVDIFA